MANLDYDTNHAGEAVVRVRDGTNTTHSALGVATLDDGRAYRFHVVRAFDRNAPRGERLEVYAALYQGGRSVPFHCLKALRVEIADDFRAKVQAWAEAL